MFGILSGGWVPPFEIVNLLLTKSLAECHLIYINGHKNGSFPHKDTFI